MISEELKLSTKGFIPVGCRKKDGKVIEEYWLYEDNYYFSNNFEIVLGIAGEINEGNYKTDYEAFGEDVNDFEKRHKEDYANEKTIHQCDIVDDNGYWLQDWNELPSRGAVLTIRLKNRE